MFSKVIVLFLLAASAIAGVIPEGTYQITNVASQSTARVDYGTGEVYVSTDDPGGISELWTLKDAKDNGYTIYDVELDTFAAVDQPVDGELVVTSSNSTVFNIEPAGDNTFVIKLPYDDLLWNVEPNEPVVLSGQAVALRPADGTKTQRWIFTSAPLPPT